VSMRLLRKSCKITEVTARKLRFENMLSAGGWTGGEHLNGLKAFHSSRRKQHG
jgi:hypothetical protein